MGKIREKLIHLLGGKTISEFNRESVRAYKQAKMDTLFFVLNTIDDLSHKTSINDRLESIVNSIDRMHYDACINYNKYKNIL